MEVHGRWETGDDAWFPFSTDGNSGKSGKCGGSGGGGRLTAVIAEAKGSN